MVAVLREANGGFCASAKVIGTKKIVMVEGESASKPWTQH